VPALLAYVDGEGRYLWANEAYRRWFGVSPDSIRGRSIRDIVGDIAWPTVEPHVTRALAGEDVCYETQISYGNGHHDRAVRAAYFPDRDAEGHVRGFVSFVTDVSEVWNAQRALRESERMLAVVVDTTPAMIARYDAALRLVWICRSTATRRSSGSATRAWAWRPTCSSGHSTSSCRTSALWTALKAASASG